MLGVALFISVRKAEHTDSRYDSNPASRRVRNVSARGEDGELYE